jgi:TrmH family RNA methyltransferase
MMNFGCSDLVLVNAAPVDEHTRQRAVHAQAVLDAARHFPTLAEAKKEFDHVVGFAARISRLDKAHLRMGESLETVARRLDGMGGRVALVFGREDFGLSNEDVEICDILCGIPTSPAYRSMNLSHAVTVALYEMTRASHAQMPYITMATAHEKEVLLATWWHLTATLRFPEHKRIQSLQMFRRVVGRAGLTAWEYHRMMGVISRSLKRMKAWPPPGPEWLPPDGEDEERPEA